MAKQAVNAPRTNMFMLDPDELVLIGHDTGDGQKHPLWVKPERFVEDESMVRNIMQNGIIQPIRARKNGDAIEVIAGRRRVINARVAKKRQEAAGEETVRVPVVMARGTDQRIAGVVASENAIRKDDTLMAKAELAQRLIDFGNTENEVAVSLGVEVQSIRNWLALLDLDVSVKKAVDTGELSASAAVKLAALAREEQKATLEKMRADGDLTTKVAAATVRAKKTNGARVVVPGKKTLKKLIEYNKEADAVDATFLEGVAFAIGALPPSRVKGLTAALREIGYDVA